MFGVCVRGVNCFRQGKHIGYVSIDTIPLFESSGNVIVAWKFSRLVRVKKNPSPPPPCVTFYFSLSHFNAARLCIPVIDGNLLRSFLFYFYPNTHTPGNSLVNNRWWRIVFPLEFVCAKIFFFFSLLPAPRKSLIIRNVTQSRFLALHIRAKKKLTPTGLERNLSRKCTSGRETFSKYFYIEK